MVVNSVSFVNSQKGVGLKIREGPGEQPFPKVKQQGTSLFLSGGSCSCDGGKCCGISRCIQIQREIPRSALEKLENGSAGLLAGA